MMLIILHQSKRKNKVSTSIHELSDIWDKNAILAYSERFTRVKFKGIMRLYSKIYGILTEGKLKDYIL
jgi:hypothetical protein